MPKTWAIIVLLWLDFLSATVILITHRPASLALADRIVRLAHGRVTDITPAKKEQC